MSDLGLSLDADSASNLLAGLFESTNNLSDPKVTADTYMAVANCLRVGGKKPGVLQKQPEVVANSDILQQPAYDWNALSAAIGQKVTPQTQSVPDFITPQPSPEERPAGEGVISETIEPEWLTPKIFKGTSIG